MDFGSTVPAPLTFLAFELRPAQRLLLRHGCPVAIGARAFDLLVLLATHPGEVLSNRALMAGVWPHTVVIEANLRVQIGALRKLLGNDSGAIVNVAGRGYCFTAHVYAVRPQTESDPHLERRRTLPGASRMLALEPDLARA